LGVKNAHHGCGTPERPGFAGTALMAPGMKPSEKEKEQRRAVEALAQSLYETENSGGVTWARRGSVIREPWLARARRQLQAARSGS